MPATMIVNGMTVVHASSSGISTAFPDTCKTPTPGGPVPIPYPNIAQSSDTAEGTSTVKVDGNPIMIESSNFKMSTGDEAGSAMGVVSNKIKGKALPKMYSMDVKADGKGVMRLSDIMCQNADSSPNTPPTPEVQPPLVVVPPSYDPPKLTKVEWSDAEKKCGDEVKIKVETENYKDGDVVLVMVTRTSDDCLVTLFISGVSGNKCELDWITRAGPGPFPSEPELHGTAYGAGDPVETSPDLKIKVPLNAKKPMAKANRTIPKVSEVTAADGTTSFQQTAGSWGWDYGFDLEIKDGVYIVTGKIKLDPQGLCILLPKHKDAWKTEIENIWSRKWKAHREACVRGDTCNCLGGCCLFPYEFVCEFVGGGEHAAVNVWSGSPDSYLKANGSVHAKWWNAANWFMQLCGHEGNGIGVRAHEFGHSMGQYDEYKKGAVFVPTNAAGAVTGQPPYADVAGSLMGPNGTTINQNHLDEYHTWLEEQTGEPYKRIRL